MSGWADVQHIKMQMKLERAIRKARRWYWNLHDEHKLGLWMAGVFIAGICVFFFYGRGWRCFR